MTKMLTQILRAIAKSIEDDEFPKEPFIVQSDPDTKYCFFIALWRNTGTRKLLKIETRSPT